MPKLRKCRPVDHLFATTGPNHNALVQRIEKPAAAVFRSFEDGDAWKEWIGIDVEWTSPQPYGVGTTRTVTTGKQQIDEYFLHWEDGRRMGFRFDRCTLPMAAFAEDYILEPRGDDACELTWHYSYEWGGPFKTVAGRLFGVGFALNGKRALAKLATFMEGTTAYD